MIRLVRQIVPRPLRNWVRQPRRSAQYVFNRIAYHFRGAETVRIRDDWSLKCHPASRAHFTVFQTDLAQRAELDMFIRHCTVGMQFLDIGAHYGLFALAATHFGGTSAGVVCIEASRKAANILESNLAANRAESQVKVLNVAMGATDGTLQMLSTGPAGSDYFVSAPAGRSDTTTVRQLSMTTVLRETGIRPTHVKMDIEGFEDDVIAGALTTLKELHAVLFLELHGGYLRARERDPATVIDHLRQCGYQHFEENGTVLSDADFASRNYECRLVCLPQAA
jgi:FkbM family methyltransferase